VKEETLDKPVGISRGEERLESEKDMSQDIINHSSPGRSSHKFGKKAWILEFQEQHSKETPPIEKLEDTSHVHKFPVKKKMLGSFFTDTNKQITQETAIESENVNQSESGSNYSLEGVNLSVKEKFQSNDNNPINTPSGIDTMGTTRSQNSFIPFSLHSSNQRSAVQRPSQHPPVYPSSSYPQDNKGDDQTRSEEHEIDGSSLVGTEASEIQQSSTDVEFDMDIDNDDVQKNNIIFVRPQTGYQKIGVGYPKQPILTQQQHSMVSPYLQRSNYPVMGLPQTFVPYASNNVQRNNNPQQYPPRP